MLFSTTSKGCLVYLETLYNECLPVNLVGVSLCIITVFIFYHNRLFNVISYVVLLYVIFCLMFAIIGNLNVIHLTSRNQLPHYHHVLAVLPANWVSLHSS
jgi:hypothetical protein